MAMRRRRVALISSCYHLTDRRNNLYRSAHSLEWRIPWRSVFDRGRLLEPAGCQRIPTVYKRDQFYPAWWERIAIQAGSGDLLCSQQQTSFTPPRCLMSVSSQESIAVRSPAENCARIRKLGYIAGKHVNLYGEHMELVSDPFVEGDCGAAQAISSVIELCGQSIFLCRFSPAGRTCFRNLQNPLNQSSPQRLRFRRLPRRGNPWL